MEIDHCGNLGISLVATWRRFFEHKPWQLQGSSDGRDNLGYIGGKQEAVAFKQCDSANQIRFNGEIVIHYPGVKGLDKPLVIFPESLGQFALCLHVVHGFRTRIATS